MSGSVLFFADTEGDIDQFIREYVVDAIGRVDSLDFCDGLSFDRDEQLNPEGGSVVLAVMSDFEAFIDHERERWQEYREAGLVTDWETQPTDEEELEARFGERGNELARRLVPLAGRMGKLAYEEFDDEPFPPAEDVYPDEDGMPVGWWLVLHHLTVGNLGYSPHEEIQLYRSVLDEDLRLIAEREGPNEVDDEINALIDDLEQMRDEVKEGRQQS